jgi:hypothetical protein
MGVAEVRAQALEVAAGWSAPGAPPSWRLTAALFEVIAGHEDLLGRLAALPPDRQPALLASAAIRFIVRRDGPEPLAGYFPEPGMPQPRFDGGFFPAARAFCSDRLDDILGVCEGHRYQMNEVARCTQIALGIAAIQSPADPVALVDLGTGAGFGLQLDRYRYQVGGEIGGDQAAALTLHCEVRGLRQPPPTDLPPIAERAGIDLHPVDPGQLPAHAWLEACCPPEASALTRLSAAIGLASMHPERIIEGDVVDALPGVIASLRTPRLVVVDAYLAVFLPAERRARLARILADAGCDRSVTWLSLDPLVPLGLAGRDSVQGIGLPRRLIDDYQHSGVFAVLGARTFRGGSGGARLLARAHPSGCWVEWLGPETGRFHDLGS